MDDAISKNKYVNSVKVAMSAEDNKKKYSEGSDKDCTLKILQSNKDEIKDERVTLDTSLPKTEDNIVKNGEIIVTSVLEYGDNQCLQGMKINLYKINGLSPVLIKSKITDEDGKVVFSEVEEGCYRIIEIVDKRYFEKPKYISWNEIIIDDVNKNKKLTIVNRSKRFV